MDTGALKKFAQEARRYLIDQVDAKIEQVLNTDSGLLREKANARKELEEKIKETSRAAVVERVAYIWFNRFCALRFMDANRYTSIGVVSPAQGFTLPEILQEAKQGHIDADYPVDTKRVMDLLTGTISSPDAQQEAYKLLLVGVCNYYNQIMPFMFEKIEDYTELLMPDDLLSESSILTSIREVMTPDVCQDVEVIGWLYQFYISEKKDEVMARKSAVPVEDIPAVTQLFTPHWIVRYMVENSLGRLWMLNNPMSRLIEKMDYYIKPEQDEADFLRVSSPEELKICDPACGSGHILVYAFDLLYAIYEERGYDAHDIPEQILTKNLYGIEIDERAGELAGLALTVKARSKDRRFFNRKVYPNICVLENVSIDEDDLNVYMNTVGRDLFTADLQTTLNQFTQADTFGSLIVPTLRDVAYVREVIGNSKVAADLFLASTHDKVCRILKQADYLCQKYHVVIANPPYMGSKGMNPEIKAFAQAKYPKSKSDLCAMFIERNIDLTVSKGIIAMITMQSWMFLSSYEQLRATILQNAFSSLVHIGYNTFPELNSKVVQGVAFVLRRQSSVYLTGVFLDLNSAKQSADKHQVFLRRLRMKETYAVANETFNRIPGSPIAYWVSERVRLAFDEGFTLSDVCEMQPGLQTSNNERFLRYWHEVALGRIGFGYSSSGEARTSGKAWFPYNKGGDYRKWFGNNEYVVNWENDGTEIKRYVAETYPYLKGNIDYVVKDRGRYFKESATWTKISSSAFAVRKSDPGFLFDVAGSSAFPSSDDIYWVVGLLTSKLAFDFLKAMNPTLNFQVGNVEMLPIPRDEVANIRSLISSIAMKAVEIERTDWDSYETSWDFRQLPLLQELESGKPTPRLSEVYANLRSHWYRTTLEMQKIEEENNRIFNESYGLQDELIPDVPLNEITLTCNPHYRYSNGKTEEECNNLLLTDTIEEFISYAVGCMFGRYSLDKPGLILANQGETIDDYHKNIPEPSFEPDADNVIPILDSEWFADDIVERFRRFLKITFAEENFSENLKFIESAIGKDIRKFFTKDFYSDHIKRYKKRPIYWLFSSPKGTFNALIYMHRYRPDTVSVILNYLKDFKSKLEARLSQLQSVTISPSASQSDKTQAMKETEKVRSAMKELEDWERKVLYPLAVKQIDIDLDDGVKVNYAKFENALKKIPGMESGED